MEPRREIVENLDNKRGLNSLVSSWVKENSWETFVSETKKVALGGIAWAAIESVRIGLLN